MQVINCASWHGQQRRQAVARRDSMAASTPNSQVKNRANNARALSGAGKRTAASGVAWSGCASLRGPLCAGEALLEARTQASVALFKLGAHSATLRPEFGGPKSLRCCCAKGVGHRAQLMLRARRGARENDYPVPLLRTPTPQKLSLSCPHSGGSQLPSPSTSCHRAQLPQGAAGDAPPQSASTPTHSSPTSAAERAESKQASHCILACSWSAAFCGHEHGGVGVVARIVPAHRPFLP